MLETYRTLPTPYRLVVTTTATLAVMLVFTTILDLMADGISPGFANKDFANYWTAGKLVLSDRTMDLFGPQSIYFANLTAAFGLDYQWHNWSYPPHYLLLIWPLGLLGYKAAMMLFLGVTGPLCLGAAGFRGPRQLDRLVIAPSVTDHPDDGPRLQFLFAAAMLVPIWMMPLGTIWLPLAPAILLGVFGVALVRSGALDGFGLRWDGRLLERRN